jgi:hypothetical protein
VTSAITAALAAVWLQVLGLWAMWGAAQGGLVLQAGSCVDGLLWLFELQ